MRQYCLLFSSIVLSFVPRFADASSPDCSGPNNWASNMAYVHLKNAGLLQPETTDFAKTQVTRLASEKIGKDLYRQVHQVTFAKTSMDKISVVTVSDASHEECSMSRVDVFVISQELGDLK